MTKMRHWVVKPHWSKRSTAYLLGVFEDFFNYPGVSIHIPPTILYDGFMNSAYEKKIAQNMIKQRDCGYSIAEYFKKTAPKYTIRAIITVVLAATYFASDVVGIEGLLAGGAGLLIGATIRDCIWLLFIKRNWPFSEKVTDWDKVKAIAEADTP